MDRETGMQSLTEFTWERQPEAEKLVRELVAEFLARCPEAKSLAERMTAEMGTRFVDWIDLIVMPRSDRGFQSRLNSAGFTVESMEEGDNGATAVYVQSHGVFPRFVIAERTGFEVWVKVDSVADFLAANPWAGEPEVEGQSLARMRTASVAKSASVALRVVERHGDRGRFPSPSLKNAQHGILSLHHLELFRRRRREFSIEDAGFGHCEKLIDAAIADLGVDLACDLFFAAEREYWQRRNRAAQFQKARQDRLGLGWANHDHHTYRCSRKHFSRLIGIWEKLGFELRERFYAGAEAGWGAQICEQPNAGIITFNDVDLSPDELMNDFAHEPLPERTHLGTVGLWCGLHGESFLQAGMHHLECQFDFDSLKQQMEAEGGIKVMKPFTDFPYLRQAFTEGERWAVHEDRLAALLSKGQITQEQAAQFRANGAIGSHLENLERNEGFKGFNQKGVSEIIAKTDPRRNL